MIETIGYAFGAILLTMLLIGAGYLTYVIRIRNQWQNILRETAFSASQIMKTYASKLEDEKKTQNGIYPKINTATRQQIADLFKQ